MTIPLGLRKYAAMSDPNITFPLVLLWAAPVFALTLSIEWVLVSAGILKGRYERKDAISSIALGIGNLLSDILMGAISLGVLMWMWQFRLFDWGVSLPIIFLCLIAQDFTYYWKHRAAHRIRWFWTAHVVHHSSQHYNLTTALRQPWNNHFTGFVLLTSPLIILGFHPLLVGFVGGINLIYQYWIHTEAIDRMPKWFEALMNTPSHHRAHHGTNPQYLDANYAGIFIIWDKMFGTFVPEDKQAPVTYGLVSNYATFNPIKIAVLEIIAVFQDVFQRKDLGQTGPNIAQRLKYLFAPPGYSHDGSRQSSASLKRQYVRDNPHMAGRAGLPDMPTALTEPAE
ncbi:MAG: sterol desaturase family protein [Litorimonas sp.]